MKLRKISIKNFRNLRRVDVYPRKMTVIVGENNAGKSNFIHALRLLLAPEAERLRLDLSKDDINSAAYAARENYFYITVEIGDLQKHIEVETCFKERIDKDGDETFVTIQGKYEPDEDGEYIWKTKVLPPKGRFNDSIPMSRSMSRAVPLYFLDAVRDATRDTRATGGSLLAQLLSEVDYTDVQDDVKIHIANANTALNKGQDIAKLANGLTKQLTLQVPGGQSKISVAIAPEETSRLVNSFRLNISKTPGSSQSEISRHGTGLQNLILMAMFRHKVASETQGTPILAIEEPEAHLHPHAQRSLFKDLSSIDAPIILTTHSPAIVKYADPLSLVLFRSTALDETTAYQLNPNQIDDSNRKDLALLMRGGRADLFFARAIIIVEGESELIALPAFAEILGCDLDRDGISLVSADGNNYAFILKSCQADQFAIPTTVTYDTDVLEKESKLLNQAYKAGLIDQTTYQSHKSQIPDAGVKRKEVLRSLGWIGATECFEEEVCQNGYLDVVIQAIKDADLQYDSQTKALEDHLHKESLTKDAKGITSFIKKRDNLKIPVARAVADAAKTVRSVPDCYARAIRKAVLESVGGIPVDEYFEIRACSCGFLEIMLKTIESANALDAMQQFLDDTGCGIDAMSISKFLRESEAGMSLREQVKFAVADAVEIAGCQQYAELIRKSTFSISGSGEL